MKKALKFTLPLLVVLSFLFVSSAYGSLTAPMKQISALFDQINTAVNHQKEIPLAQGTNFQISAKDFVFFKNNIKMFYTLQNKQFSLSDDQLINEMLKKRLAAQYAKKMGIKVSAQEINKEINIEKTTYESTATTQNNLTALEIMKNRIRISGLSESAFWKSNKVRKGYERILLVNKLYILLQKENKIHSMKDFIAFKDNLLMQSTGKIKIDKSVLQH